MAHFNYKIVLSNGFRDHKLVMTFDVDRPHLDTVTATFNAFAVGVIDPVEGQILVNADTVEDTINRGRVFYWFENWLVDIYAEEV